MSPLRPTPPVSAPSIDEAATRLVRQLDKSLGGHRASGDAFVASVYGEWGIGKTYCLKGVFDIYQRRLDERIAALSAENASAAVVVPAWFAPWRYEHEEHLVVPMLKTIEFKLADVAEAIDKVRTELANRAEGRDDFIQRAEAAGNALRRGAQTTGRLAQSLLSGIKFKLAPMGVGLDIDPKASIEQTQKHASAVRAEREKKAEARSRESMYFDAQTELEALTDPTNPVPLQLVVLVDDLDRCLPEKAVQVLESVKLFLNVPGFSFVLAIDDEVVERGIAHRYRDYRLADKDGNFSGDVPISGTQYLEKIVHLPVHLPRWTIDKARRFLQHSYPQLYGSVPDTGADSATAGLAAERDGGAADKASRRNEPADAEARAALELVLKAIPPVPRKLIRLSEGVEHLRAQFQDLAQTGGTWSALHAIRVVALAQLHPTLYRHVRQRAGRYWRLFELQRDVWDEPRFRSGDGLAAMKARFTDRAKAPADSSAQQREVDATGRENLSMLECVQHSGSQRGAGDPLALFAVAEGEAVPEPSDLGLLGTEFHDLYFAGAAPPLRPVVPGTGEVGAIESAVGNTGEAVAALLSSDAVSRREFIEAQGLRGKRLPAAVHQALLAEVAADQAEALTVDLRWLRDMASLMSAEQLLGLYAAGKVVERWVEASKDGQREGSP